MADAATNQSIDVGTVLAGTYGILRLLGKGGMGSVWEARHLRLEGKKVAIKVLHAEVAGDAESVARFRREAQIASRLGHPNIVQVIDFNELDDGTQYLVLEYLEGESLADRLARGPLPVDQALAVVREVGSALHAAHRENIVHRDLKPHNIFLCLTETAGYATETAKVLDFGISKMRDSQTVQTQANTVLGTPQYMAPEQALGHHDQVDGRTDIFALGAILYEMVAGRPAFQGSNIPEVMFKVVYEEPPPLHELVPSLDPAMTAAVHRALAKKLDMRFGDVSQMVEALTGHPLSTLRGGHVVVPMSSSPAGVTPRATPAMTPRGTTGLMGPRARSDDAFAATAAPGLQATGQATAHTGAQAVAQTGMDATMLPGGNGSDPGRAAVARTAAVTSGSAAVLTEPVGEPVAATSRGMPLGLIFGLVAVAVAVAVAVTIVFMKRPGENPREATAVSDPGAVAIATGEEAEEELAGPGEHGDERVEQGDEQIEPGVAGAQGDEKSEQQARGDGDRAGGENGSRDEDRTESSGAATTAKKPPRPPRSGADDDEPELTGPLAEQLQQARALFKSGKYENAIREARRSLATRRTTEAYAIITSAYCAQRDLGNAQANMSHVKGRRARMRVKRFCQNYDIDLSDR